MSLISEKMTRWLFMVKLLLYQDLTLPKPLGKLDPQRGDGFSYGKKNLRLKSCGGGCVAKVFGRV